MDSDNDGEISAHKIEIAKLPILVLEKIAPLLCEMEQMNLTLDFFNFQLAFNKLANVNYQLVLLIIIYTILHRTLLLMKKIDYFLTLRKNGMKKKKN